MAWRSAIVRALLVGSLIPGARVGAQCLEVIQPAPSAIPASTSSPSSLVWESVPGRGVYVASNGETWGWNGSGFARLAPPFGPFNFGASYITCAYDSARGKIVAYGGRRSGVDSGLTHEWDGTSWTQVAGNGPAPRAGQAMAYDSVRERVVLVGGFPIGETCTNYFGDTWGWDGAGWTLLADADAGPGPRGDCGLAFDEARGVLVLYGGFRLCAGQLGDTWEFDGTTWTNRTPAPGPPAPPPSYWTAMYYNSDLHRVELFTPTDPHALWSWDGQRWTPRAFYLSSTPLFGGSYVGAAFDRGRGQAMCLRSSNMVRVGDRRPTVSLASPAEFVARVGGTNPPPTTFRVTATSTATPMTYQWRRNGVPITTRFVGAATATMSPPSSYIESDFGEYTCAITNSCGTTISSPIVLRRACPADVYHAGFQTPLYADDAVTIEDLLWFITAFTGGWAPADLDDDGDPTTGVPDGAITIEDLLFFLAHYQAGC